MGAERADDMRGHVDFDTAVNEAWARYRHLLAALLSDLDDGQELVVQQSLEIPEGSHGVLSFSARDDRIVCTIVEDDLHPHPDVMRGNIADLTLLGWDRNDGDGSFTSQADRAQVDALAALTTTTLIEVWGVGHPAFLTGDAPARHEPALEVIALPARHSDLRAMVVEALGTMSGHPVMVDDDGDIPLPTGEVKSWLRILRERPTLEFFGIVVDRVADLPAAYRFVATETLPYTGIKLVVHDTCVVAVLTVEATAFARHNVAAGIGQWLQFVDEVRPKIVSALTDDACGPGL
ncbi:hypothetical protein EF294_06060 [Gordonia oryzae]|uniref:Uncharacterized protein n=1 Tax=Gordonia oryzae TaxID=2487349 RepID=A0A3N4GTC4_9ACTN|nr:hypothetical protein [Gordonia oryzae]RPA64697.1 hypothetical protein EF294_06060 [Gordonia oryzae]